jgi:NAD(P)-dependent dehydrogenase (short-subunit alcohol dehydrogenase family)
VPHVSARFEAASADARVQEPTPVKDNIEINLTSVLLFARMALAYMKSDSASDSTDGFSKSIVLTSSIAGITEAPGLFAYSSAKHGVIGTMRALRRFAPAKFGVRANAICPWATDTQLLSGVKEQWVREKMPMNRPKDVANMIVQCAADPDLNGTAIFVAGGRGFDTEEGIDRTLPQWMGQENSEVFLRGQEILGLGGNWVK